MAAKKTEGNTTKFSKTDFDKAVKGIIKEFKLICKRQLLSQCL